VRWPLGLGVIGAIILIVSPAQKTIGEERVTRPEKTSDQERVKPGQKTIGIKRTNRDPARNPGHI